MEIIKRHKNVNGDTIGYTVRNNGKETYLNKQVVVSMFGTITNAHLIKNGEFRANDGERIETVVDNANLSIKQQSKLTINKGVQIDSNLNYYGSEFINISKKIRKYAIDNKLEIDERKHKSNNGNNTHLFRLINACGISVKSFIRGYLSVLQPYSLSKFQRSKELGKSNIWLSDMGYGFALVIKINDSDKNKPLVVSFHESNIHGSFTSGAKDFSDKLCAVLINEVSEIQDKRYKVKYTIQRGFLRYTCDSITNYYNNGVALVDYRDISSIFDRVIESIFNNIMDTYKDDNIEDVPALTLGTNTFSHLSFMSLGFNTVNNICLLIDLYSQYTDTRSRVVIIGLTQNILYEVPDYKLIETKSALNDKYINSSNKLYLAIKEM